MVAGSSNRRERTLFLPCVLDRLTDLNPESSADPSSRVVPIQELKRSVIENITLLLNSKSHPRSDELVSDSVRDSVLGFGVGDFCGVTRSIDRTEKLRREILRQIRSFEPRLDGKLLSVEPVVKAAEGSQLEYEIRGVIRVSPLAQELVFRARLNLETGATSIE